tara:strand:+ start:246 stop:443 length:198 start_codon:yes stop_codon:yes gene_type:complete
MPFRKPKNKPINLLIDPNPTTFINLEKIKPKTAEMIKVDIKIPIKARTLDICSEFMYSSIKSAGK